MNAHPHAENMRLYAEDAAETDKPELRWEFSVDNGESWQTVPYNHPSWLPQAQYRRKPKPLECWVIHMDNGTRHVSDAQYEKGERISFDAGLSFSEVTKSVRMREVTE